MGVVGKLEWPKYNLSIINDDEIKIVVQINGKKRSILSIKKGIEENDVLDLAKKDKIIEKYLKNKEVKKIIFIKDRLINILINE